ncbi:MAG TPA: hypothetical protein PLF42_06245 [Anaerolineales bacterium]|nr:hypothetical protein [Anaerolineales bacterium]
MKEKHPHQFDKLSARPEHYSYRLHRKQRTVQIFLPVILSAVLFVGMIALVSFATFEQGGDVGRWAAISTIWIVIPVLVACPRASRRTDLSDGACARRFAALHRYGARLCPHCQGVYCPGGGSGCEAHPCAERLDRNHKSIP